MTIARARPARVAAFAVLGVAAVSLLILVVAMAVFRERQLHQAERDSQFRVQLVEEIAAGNVRMVDHGLRTVVQDLAEQAPQPGAEDIRQRLLRARVDSLPQARAMWVLDAQGRIVSDSDAGNLGHDLSGRDYFLAHREGAGDGLLIGKAVRSRSTGTWFVPLSRAVRGADGALEFVVVAALEPAYFAGLWGRADAGQGSSIEIFLRDGTLLMRAPFDDAAVGRSFADQPVFRERLAATSAATYRARSRIDAVERIFSARVVRDYPQLVVLVGQPLAMAVGEWSRVALMVATIWLVAVVIVAVLAYFLARELRHRRRAEAEVASLARLADEDPDPVLRLDGEGAVLYANPAAQRLRAAIEGDAEGAGAAWTAFLARAAHAVVPWTTEEELAGRTYSLAAIPVSAAGYVNIHATDITELRLAERLARAQLARTEMLHRITRAMGDRLDLGSVLQVMSDSLLSQLPVDFSAIALVEGASRRLVMRRIARGSHATAHAMSLGEGTDLGDAESAGVPMEGEPKCVPHLAQAPGGMARMLALAGFGSAVLAPLQVEGRPFGLLVVARVAADAFSREECAFLGQLGEHAALAAQQAQLHATLRQAYDELMRTQRTILREEGLRTLGQLAGGLAHDINNAISPVALYADALMEGEPGLSERGRAYLDNIQRAIVDVATTVERMREFNRPRGDDVARPDICLNHLVRQAADLASVQLGQGASAVTVETHLQEDLPVITASEDGIRAALMNLVSNAQEAMPDGGRLVFRTGSAVSGDGTPRIYVEVTDTGIGMDETTTRRCLEPFFSKKRERGSGLGLAMVYGSMQRHGGDVEIESALGRGTTVRLLFPVAEAEGARTPPPPAGRRALAPAESPAASVRASLRVLLVDDDAAVLRSLERMLEFDGHEVTAAGGGRAGIEAFEAALREGRPFDVVITDLGMPDIDGRGVARAVKALHASAGVILLTGWGEQIRVSEDGAAQVDQVIGKPPRLAHVRQALQRYA